MNKLKNSYKEIRFLIIDIIAIIMANIFSIMFLNKEIIINLNDIIGQLFLTIVVYEFVLNSFTVYKNMVRYETGEDYIKYMICSFLSLIIILIIGIFIHKLNIQYRVVILTCILSPLAMILYRMFLRYILNSKDINKINTKYKKNNLLIIGAGISAREIVMTIKSSMPERYNIIGLIDDNPHKLNHKICDISVIGTRFDIPKIVQMNDVDLIFFAINKIDSLNRQQILKICQETNVKTRVLPTTERIIDDQGAFNSLRNVEIEDLLGRETISFEDKKVFATINNKIVLVTGGGGSIGSELCRQIANFNPKKLIIFDIYENNLYDIEMELRRNYPKLDLHAVVGSVRDKCRLDNVFSKFKPDIVFHAAAHKHVPLMEYSPLEAIKNNIFGTLNVANCADEFKTSNFILISTDKAVNPTNIMGASKRVCEMIIQTKSKTSKTKFAAVRFGNVLGSNGSVIPLFKKQIENGGPVTLTHKEITRFFMTIPEAVQLILQALTYANGGEIFTLDMGEPVKIYDLAVNLIKLMGYEPDVDIPIKIIGLRPGEKLYEELLMAEEGLTATKHNKIFISNPIDLNEKELENNLNKLSKLEYNKNFSNEKIIEIMKKTVSTYRDSNEVNNKKKEYDLCKKQK